MGITFEEFKSYFEFALEVSGAATGLGFAVAYRTDVMFAIFRVARGRATSTQLGVALEAMDDGGAVARQVVGTVADGLSQINCPREASNLERLRQQAASRAPSPGQMA